jgi:vacuolar-type H+-ATPase subunit H
MAVPGRAGLAGVPVDRATVLREELAPVFAALRATESDATDTVSRATRESNNRTAHANLEAQRILDQASTDQTAARLAAAADVENLAAAAESELNEAADREIERINREAARKIGPLVDEVVVRILSYGAPPGTSP